MWKNVENGRRPDGIVRPLWSGLPGLCECGTTTCLQPRPARRAAFDEEFSALRAHGVAIPRALAPFACVRGVGRGFLEPELPRLPPCPQAFRVGQVTAR